MSNNYDVSEFISLINEAPPLTQEQGVEMFKAFKILLKISLAPGQEQDQDQDQEQEQDTPQFHRTYIDKKSGKKIFYALKENLPEDSGALKKYPSGDFPWDPAFKGKSHNVPREKVHVFCPTCRKIPEEEFKEMSAR